MRHILTTIFFLTICLWGHSQVDTGIYSVKNNRSISIRLELADNGTFKYYDSRASSCYLWGMTYGNYKVHSDTLFLYYKRLQQRANNDTTYQAVQYTMYDGYVITVNNAIIVTELKKYRIDNSVLYLIKNDKDNQAANWGDFDFALNK
jgi:hypothetical protein